MNDDYVKRSDVHKAFQPKYAPAINRTFAAMIDSVPAANVVEVVRCRECEFTYKWRGRLYCRRLRDRWNHNNDRMVEDTDFCKWGKRKDD